MNETNATFQLYNVLSCKGFETSEGLGLTFGPCAQAKLGFVFLFFINALLRKWIGETMGIEYSFWGGMAGGFLGYLILITIFGNFAIAFVVGLVGIGLGGFLGGAIFGGSEE